jgi:regulatory protein
MPPPAVPHETSVDQAPRALRLALAYLDRRERTTAEVHAYLERKGFDEDIAEQVVADLTEQGYLDDLRFARLFAADKRELEHWGAGRIRRTLLQRGLGPEVIAAALSTDGDVGCYEAELGRALEVLTRRFPAALQTRRDRDRALGVLVRKGYEPEIALDALAAYARGE